MNGLERNLPIDPMPDFGMDTIGLAEGFDINAAFQEAVKVVIADSELAFEEKVRRMEVIITEGESELYRDFVDFRQMATQLELLCNHDHEMNQSLQSSETLSGFMSTHKSEDGHSHDEMVGSIYDHKKDDDEYEIDPKTGKKTKKKKRRGWLAFYAR